MVPNGRYQSLTSRSRVSLAMLLTFLPSFSSTLTGKKMSWVVVIVLSGGRNQANVSVPTLVVLAAPLGWQPWQHLLAVAVLSVACGGNGGRGQDDPEGGDERSQGKAKRVLDQRGR